MRFALPATLLLASLVLILAESFWSPVMDISFVVGGAVIAALAGYLLIDELSRPR